MGGQINTEELLSALRLAGEALRGTGRALRIRQQSGGQLLITGSGDTFQASVTVDFDGDEGMELIAPSVVLVKALAQITNPKSEFGFDSRTRILTLKDGRDREISIRALESVAVSPRRTFENATVVGIIDAADLRRINEVSQAASESHEHPSLSGVRLRGSEVQATNGFWAAESKIASLALEVTIPTNVIHAIARSGQTLEVLVAGSQVIFKSNRIEWMTSTIEGAFPDLSRVFGRAASVVGEVEVASLRTALLFAESLPGQTVELELTRDGGVVLGADSETGSIFSSFAATMSAPCGLSLNRAVLRATIEMHTSRSVKIETDGQRWIRIGAKGNRQFIMLRRVGSSSHA